MASIREEISLDRSAEEVWAAVRDVGALHERLVRGFVTDTRLEGNTRVVTFANGMVARELIVDVDDALRRVAYAAKSERFEHHHASVQVLDQGPGRSTVVWVTDLLPNELAPAIAGMMQQGAAAMKQTFSR